MKRGKDSKADGLTSSDTDHGHMPRLEASVKMGLLDFTILGGNDGVGSNVLLVVFDLVFFDGRHGWLK